MGVHSIASLKTSPAAPRARARRARRAIPVVLAALLVLTGCTAEVGGNAASVGGETISDGSLRAAVDEVSKGSTEVDRERAARSVLTAQIRHLLVQKASGATGVTTSPAQAAETMAGASPAEVGAALGVPPSLAQQTLADALTASKLVTANAEQKRTVSDVLVSVDLLQGYENWADAAQARERYLADPAALDAAINAAGTQGAVKEQQLNSMQNPSAGSFGLFMAPPGSVLLIGSDSNPAVVRVVSRSVAQNPDLAQAVGAAQKSEGGGTAAALAIAWLALQPYVRDLPVTVNPRYGVWDPYTLQVVPGSFGA